MGVPKKMRRIGIDLRALGYRHQTGVQRVTYNITRELLKNPEEEYILIGKSPHYHFDTSSFVNLDLPNADHPCYDKLVSLAGNAKQFDLLFSPYYPVPERRNFKGVLLIYDLIALRHPEYFPNGEGLKQFFLRIGQSARQCERIITISEATKADVVDFFSIDPEKIVAVPLAATDIFTQSDLNKPEVANRMILAKHRIGGPYLLSTCTIEPRKNLPRLLKAYEILRSRLKGRILLVLVGALGWKYQPFVAEVEKSPFKEDIIFTGYIEDEELLVLYKNASVFVYPSLFEGFGLPVLEAMCCGIPVVTSNVSSLPEVAGDCAVYCDPYQEESIAEAIGSVLMAPSKAKEMSVRGLERSKRFTWAETARLAREALLACL